MSPGSKEALSAGGHPRRWHRQGNDARRRACPRGRRQEVRLRPATRPLRLLVLRLLRQARAHAAGGLEGADRLPRRHLLRGRRLAGEDPGSRLPLGLAAPVPARVRPVHQPAARAPDAGRADAARQPQARRHRLLGRAREHRGRVLLHRRQDVPGHRARGRHPGNRDDAHRRRPRAAIRLRSRAEAAQEAPDLGHEVERHLDHHALLGRARGGDGQDAIRM